MTRQPSLTSISLAVITFLSVAGTAQAKPCKIDADCGDGFECLLGDSAGAGGSTGTASGGVGTGAAVGTTCAGPDCPVSSPPSDPRSAPVDGGAAAPQPNPVPPVPPVTDGTCRPKQLVCTSKADCPANLDCVKDSYVAVAPCPPNTICDTPLPATQTGTCKAVCNVDTDCPSPLVCKLQGQTCMGGGSVSSDGKGTTNPTVCSGGNKICTYEPVTCSSNADCKIANFQCAKVSEYPSCSGSTPAACPRPQDGTEPACTPTPAEPPVCSSVVVNNCMPKQLACGAGQACPTGWSCFDFSYFEGVTVPGWTTPMPSKACLPDGLILTIKGQANGGSGATDLGSTPKGNGGGTLGIGGSSGASGPVTTGGDSAPPTQGPVPASDGQELAAAGDAGVEPAASKVRDGGCTLGGQGDSAGLWLTLGLAGLVLRLVRRRK